LRSRACGRATGPSSSRTLRCPSPARAPSTTPRSTGRGTVSTARGGRAWPASGQRAWPRSEPPGPARGARTRSGRAWGSARLPTSAGSSATTPARLPRTACATARRAGSVQRQPSLRCYARVTPRVNESCRLGAGPQPAGDFRPAVHGGTAPRDERDVSAGQLDVLLLAAADLVDERPNAFGRRDVVLLRADHEDRARDALETDRATAHHQFVPIELGVLIEVTHPLAEELAREGHVLVRPLVEGLEAFQVLVVPQIPPEVDVGRQVHRRLEQLEAGLDHVRRHRAERVHEAIDVEVLLAEPETEQADLREIDGTGHVDEVLHRHFRMRSDEGCGDGGAHAVAEYRQLVGARRLEHPPGHSRQDLGDTLLDREVVVLRSEHAPVQEVEVEALLRHVLDEATAREEIEDIGAADAEVGDEEYGRPVTARRLVAIEPRLVPLVDLRARRLAGLRLDRVRQQAVEIPHPADVALELVLPLLDRLGRRVGGESRSKPLDDVGEALWRHISLLLALGWSRCVRSRYIWNIEPSFIARPISPLTLSLPDMKSIWPDCLPESMSSQSWAEICKVRFGFVPAPDFTVHVPSLITACQVPPPSPLTSY